MNQPCEMTRERAVKEFDPERDLIFVPTTGGASSDCYDGLPPDDDRCRGQHRARR